MSFFKSFVLATIAAHAAAFPVPGSSNSWLQSGTGGIKLDFSVSFAERNGAKFSERKKRGEITGSLLNVGSYYTTNLTFGSSQEPIAVDIDTGSSDLWVISGNATCDLTYPGQPPDYCLQYGTFNVSDSTTIVDENESFSITYGDGTGAYGEYYMDNVGISGIIVNNVTIGVGNYVTAVPGIFGIGYEGNEASVDPGANYSYSYTNFPQELVNQGLISKNFYSLYLNGPNADTGSVIFGGIDSSKYSGDLVTIPIYNSTDEFTVLLDYVSCGNTTNVTSENVLLDSGTTASILSNSTVAFIASLYEDSTFIEEQDGYFVPTNTSSDYVTYHFGAAAINVPLNSLLVQATNSNGTVEDGYWLNVFGSDQVDASILGDNFLRWAYVVYDITDNEISLAQSIFT